MVESTLCWNCANATGGCTWSDSLIPVKGWEAIERKKNTYNIDCTYEVRACPEFVRDSYGGGTRRLPKNLIGKE